MGPATTCAVGELGRISGMVTCRAWLAPAWRNLSMIQLAARDQSRGVVDPLPACPHTPNTVNHTRGEGGTGEFVFANDSQALAMTLDQSTPTYTATKLRVSETVFTPCNITPRTVPPSTPLLHTHTRARAYTHTRIHASPKNLDVRV